MEYQQPHMPGYRMNEYVLVLHPHEDLRQRITKVRDEFSEKFKTAASKYLKPNVTLVTFQTWVMMEERIMQRLQTICMGVAPFRIELKDYGSFPSHSIFINVTTKLPVQQLVSQIKEIQRLMKMNQENKPHFLEDPHITIARKLKPWQYEQGWLEFSHRQFTGRFIADSVLLLKRPAGSKSAFQIAARFELMNLPVTTRQGSLFV
jgi:2'-5' RNA ligase